MIGKTFILKSAKISAGKERRIYADKGDSLFIYSEQGNLYLVRNERTGERFSITKNFLHENSNSKDS